MKSQSFIKSFHDRQSGKHRGIIGSSSDYNINVFFKRSDNRFYTYFATIRSLDLIRSGFSASQVPHGLISPASKALSTTSLSISESISAILKERFSS